MLQTKVLTKNNLLIGDNTGDMIPVFNIGSIAAGQVTPNPRGHPNILRLQTTNQVCKLLFLHDAAYLIHLNVFVTYSVESHSMSS